MVLYTSLCLGLGWRYNYSGTYKSRYINDWPKLLISRNITLFLDSSAILAIPMNLYQFHSDSLLLCMWSARKKNEEIAIEWSQKVEFAWDDVWRTHQWLLRCQAWETFIAHVRSKDSFDTFNPSEKSLSCAGSYWEDAEKSNKGFYFRVKVRDSGQCWGESWRKQIWTMIFLFRFPLSVPVVDLITERRHIWEVYSI